MRSTFGVCSTTGGLPTSVVVIGLSAGSGCIRGLASSEEAQPDAEHGLDPEQPVRDGDFSN